MQTIYKYTLQVMTEQSIGMPKDAVVLDVQTQGHSVVIWAEVETENETEQRKFFAYMTGQRDLNLDDVDYIGTTQLDGIVVHVYEERSLNAVFNG